MIVGVVSTEGLARLAGARLTSPALGGCTVVVGEAGWLVRLALKLRLGEIGVV